MAQRHKEDDERPTSELTYKPERRQAANEVTIIQYEAGGVRPTKCRKYTHISLRK